MKTPSTVTKNLQACKTAARELRAVSSEKKNDVLKQLTKQLRDRSEEILKANQKDLTRLSKKTPSAFRDRLLLNADRIESMIQSLRDVIQLPDPVGEIAESKTLSNGLKVNRVRSPLGVIFMIFESRPNVAIEAFSLALKSGNVMILRGGKEARNTTSIFYDVIQSALRSARLNQNCIWGITDPDRKIPKLLLQQKGWIDIVVPRGGDGLIDFVTKNSKIPIIKNDRGLCHVYVHEDADPEMAIKIVMNAKTQRPGVCNAMETLLVHEKQAGILLPALYAKMEPLGVEWFTDPATRKILHGKLIKPAKKDSFDTEYLDLKMSCRIVKSLEDAIAHIETHGSRHSESIVTSSESTWKKFESEVDAAAVYWNASTRFTDGFELGLGGELGISTQKLHVRGPVGLKELTNLRWVIEGSGQTR